MVQNAIAKTAKETESRCITISSCNICNLILKRNDKYCIDIEDNKSINLKNGTWYHPPHQTRKHAIKLEQ